ncbi:unknown [Firmicutes bacterium CAG:240]|nr:unknown [Firmicutes bacterium CAG:240]
MQDSAVAIFLPFSLSRATTRSSMLFMSVPYTTSPSLLHISSTTGAHILSASSAVSAFAVILSRTSPLFAYGATVGFFASNISSISSATELSPMPIILTVCETIAPSEYFFKNPRTLSLNIGTSSPGGPGRIITHLPFFSSAAPGAVPWLFSNTVPPTGSIACLRLFLGILPPFDLKYERMRSAVSSSSLSSKPMTSQQTSFVRSSSVGPSPPEVITTSLRPRAVFSSCARRSGLSPTELRCMTDMPIAASSFERNCSLVLRISPSRSSVPTQRISHTAIVTHLLKKLL